MAKSMGWVGRVAGVVAVMAASIAAPMVASATPSAGGRSAAKEVTVVDSCATPPEGQLRCFAERVVTVGGAIVPAVAPSGFGPSDLLSAYNASPTGGVGRTIAIVDAYDDPNAETDLATYRTQYGLGDCTTANGCFKKVNQNGSSSSYPAANAGWAEEIALDLDMASAMCRQCNILLVEATSATTANLGTAVNRAVTMGATVVSNSYGGSEYSGETSDDTNYFKHPGVPITVSSGDNGYGVEYPASSPWVTSVGGTSLVRDSGTTRGWSETVWNRSGGGPGSGCSAYETKPTFQADAGCAKRTVADISAVADPGTGVAVYHTYGGDPGWLVFGGTSVAAPLVGGLYALAKAPEATRYPNSFAYSNPGALNDVTVGNNIVNGGVSCGTYLCTAGVGYDGPTGLGTPNGLGALQATVPGAPTAATATGGVAQATVSWTAPANDGGAGVTAYVVTPYIGAVAKPASTFLSTATTQTITGLTSGSTYTFKVHAVNTTGAGPDSAASNAIVVGGTLPSAPAFLSSSAGTSGNGQATVSWWPANGNGSPITKYIVTPYIGGVAQVPQTFNSAANSDVVTGLTNGTSYTFTVQAVTAAGTGPASNMSPALLVGLPSAPAFLTSSAGTSGNGQATVTWWPSNGNGSAITKYIVTPYVGGVAQAPQTFNSSSNSAVVTGLTNGTTYTFKVQGGNAVGTGPASNMSPALKVGLPTAPAFLTSSAGTSGNGQATVNWWPANGNGSPITGYIVTPYVGGVAQAPQTFNSSSNSAVVTGLTNGTTYTFKVQGVNAVGTGALSNMSPALKVGLPTAPAFLTSSAGTPGNGQATVKWWPASGNGSALTGYIVTPYIAGVAQAPQTFNSPVNSAVVTGLTNGTTYTFKVQAINTVGTGPSSNMSPALLVGP